MRWLRIFGTHKFFGWHFSAFEMRPGFLAQAEASPANLFDFNSGFWINLHHFLYRQLSFWGHKRAKFVGVEQADSD
jgi:hypothetical protein